MQTKTQSTPSRRNLLTQQSPVILDLCLKKTRSGKSRDYRDVIVLEKLRFQNVFRPHENEKTTESFHIEHLKPEVDKQAVEHVSLSLHF